MKIILALVLLFAADSYAGEVYLNGKPVGKLVKITIDYKRNKTGVFRITTSTKVAEVIIPAVPLPTVMISFTNGKN